MSEKMDVVKRIPAIMKLKSGAKLSDEEIADVEAGLKDIKEGRWAEFSSIERAIEWLRS